MWSNCLLDLGSWSFTRGSAVLNLCLLEKYTVLVVVLCVNLKKFGTFSVSNHYNLESEVHKFTIGRHKYHHPAWL